MTAPSRKVLLALAERCEKATGADRALDAEIAAMLRVGTDHDWALKYPAWIGKSDGRVHLEKHGPSFAAPTYTVSLDAAMGLVPSAVTWGVGSGTLGHYARIVLNEPEAIHWSRDADTPALALCAAALRARATLDGSRAHG